MPTTKDLFASLKREHNPAYACGAINAPVGGKCYCGQASQHAAVDAVAAQVADELANRDALIGKTGEALRHIRINYSLGAVSSDMINALLAPDAITRAIDEHRAMVAVVEAACHRADLHFALPKEIGKACDCGLCLAVAAYRAQRGSK